jgi:Protein of unknown function (DUF1501)
MNWISSRRNFISSVSTAGLLGSSLLNTTSASDKKTDTETKSIPKGKAEHCILLWLGGGASQIDTWDPKKMGDAKAKKPGSYYPSIETAIPGTQVCEHLPGCAKMLDRFNIIRTVNHDIIDEHAAATNIMHTGRAISGTVTYPSIGSIITHQKGTLNESVPAYVLIGYPNVTRGPGFLGAKSGYIYLTDTKKGPAGFTLPNDVNLARQNRRTNLLKKLGSNYLKGNSQSTVIQDYNSAITDALRLSGPEFGKIFQLDQEPDELRNQYGGEFGQRCLLARRLVESGVRFIEVSHNLNFVNGTGWDTHNDGQLNQHLLIQELDSALSSLVLDLEKRKLLDKTLIVVASEFGRPAGFDSGGGRGHYGKSFSVVMAGGGLKNGITIGETDELAQKIVSTPVSVPDWHATMHCAMGIDPHEELYAGERPVPITDNGTPIKQLFG